MYSGCWSDKSEVASNFNVELGDNIDIIFAHYSGYGTPDSSDYEMWARVLFADTAQTPVRLYEVHGSHCSCYGLEDQWKPDAVSIQNIVSDLRTGKAWGDEVVHSRLRAAMIARFPELNIPESG
jgi:hypothetical protein